jgi:hypothetical protein
MKDVHTGKGELHLGWIEPGEKICLGVGPAVLRFTAEEAEGLKATLEALLAQQRIYPCGDISAPKYTLCGCLQDRTSDTKSVPSPVTFSWEDENWGHGRG